MQNVITNVACEAIIQKSVEIHTWEMCKKESDMEKDLLIIFSIGVLLLLLKRYYIFENRLNELLLVESIHMNVNFYRMKDKP